MSHSGTMKGYVYFQIEPKSFSKSREEGGIDMSKPWMSITPKDTWFGKQRMFIFGNFHSVAGSTHYTYEYNVFTWAKTFLRDRLLGLAEYLVDE